MAGRDKVPLKEPLWDKQDGESNLNFRAFSLYRDMGWNEELEEQKRSIREVAERLGKSEALLNRWSVKFSWVERVSAYDGHIAHEKTVQLEKERLRDVSQMRKRQRDMAVNLQVKGLSLLGAIETGDAKLSEIVSLLKLGIEQERIVMGDVGEVVENRDADATEPVKIYIPDNNRS